MFEETGLNSCPIYAVSLVDDRCQSNAENQLKVIYRDPFQAADVNYTVCLSVLHSNFSNYRQLIETVELNRMFGAQRFVVYDYTTGSDVKRVLRHYEQAGILETIPWNTLPVTSYPDTPPEMIHGTPEIHYFAQVPVFL